MSVTVASYNFPLELSVSVSTKGTGPETGLTVVASIQRISDRQWLDFNDVTFKAAGWTQRQFSLTENSVQDGIYEGSTDPYLWALVPDQPTSYKAFYEITAPAAQTAAASENITVYPQLEGEEVKREIDFIGNDVLGWQEFHVNDQSREVRRFNLFDEAGARITGTKDDFITAKGLIARRELV